MIWIKLNLLIVLGLVYSLGRSEYGRLGLGEDCDSIVSEPTTIPSLQDKKCVNVSCGNIESFALEDNGNFFFFLNIFLKNPNSYISIFKFQHNLLNSCNVLEIA